MSCFITSWIRHCARARRGRYLEQAVKRAGGNLQLVDAALVSMIKSETPIRLSVRHQMTTEIHGLFLPCRIIKKSS